MTLVKWNSGRRANGNRSSLSNQSLMPFFGNELNNVFPRLWDTFSRPLFSSDLVQDFFDDTINLATGSIGTTLPAVNITETDNDLVIEMAAPGMRKKDFKIEISENQLHISYANEQQREDDRNNQWRREYSFDSFERTFTLPAIVESDKISATYTDGILRIAVPKKEEARRKPAKAVEIK